MTYDDKTLDAISDSLDYAGHSAGVEAIRQLRAERDALRAALRSCAGLAHDLNGCAVGGSVDAIVEQLLVTIDAALAARGGHVSEVLRYNVCHHKHDITGEWVETKDICSDGKNVAATDYDALAARLAEAEAMLTKRDAHLAAYNAMLNEARIQESARRGGELAAIARAEAAEARVREIVGWLEANQPDVFRRGLWDAIGATASARAVQEPGCQHDLQQPRPTVRVWHNLIEPGHQSAECLVCGSRWSINAVTAPRQGNAP